MTDLEFGACVTDLAESYAEAIDRAEPTGPLFIAGWSAGAVIALEVGHSLRRRGRHVALLAAIDGAPEIEVGLRAWAPRYWLAVLQNAPRWWVDCRATQQDFPVGNLVRQGRSLAKAIRLFATRRKPLVAPRLENFLGDSFAQYPAAQRQFMSRLFEAIMRHRPQPWAAPARVYEAEVSPLLAPAQFFAKWRRIAPQAELAIVPGNHHTMMLDPHVATLARDLAASIALVVRTPPAVSAARSEGGGRAGFDALGQA
jgi:thioesterase domain-containing protein